MKYLITGGTGSLGEQLLNAIISDDIISNYENVIVFSRDEQKQFNMKIKYKSWDNKIHYVLGDVRDFESISETIAQYRPEVVIHTAAQKHIQECDTNPMQAVKTNIIGTKNVAKACVEGNVKCACFISTDKAAQPTTLYGMTKYIAERLWVDFKNRQDTTKFVGVRYGNVLNSKGSLIPLYLELAKSSNPTFPLTNPKMTRFFITFAQAVALVMQALGEDYIPAGINMVNMCNIVGIQGINHGIFYVPKAPAACIGDIAKIFAEVSGGKVINKNSVEGEKMHEILLPGYNSKDFVMSKEDLKKFLDKEGLLP